MGSFTTYRSKKSKAHLGTLGVDCLTLKTTDPVFCVFVETHLKQLSRASMSFEWGLEVRPHNIITCLTILYLLLLRPLVSPYRRTAALDSTHTTTNESKY